MAKRLLAQLEQRADLPTYVGGWLACLSWLSVVGSTVGDVTFNVLIYSLTSIGFAVSFWLRGHADGPHWPAIRRAVVTPSVILRTCFMAFGVVPGLLGRAPFHQLVPDVATGSEEWLIGTGFMWAMALYSFGLTTDGMIAFGSVLGLAMLGLMGSSNVNPEVGVAFLTFLLGNVLMLSNMTLAHHTSRRHPTTGSRSLARWFGDQTVVAGLTVSLTALLGILLGFLLQELSPHGLAAPQLRLAAKLLPNTTPASSFASFSEQMVLGVGGAPNSDQPVFYARTADPQLWRRRVYDNFSGRVWRPSVSGLATQRIAGGRHSVTLEANLDAVHDLQDARQVAAEVLFVRDGDLVAPAMLTELTFPVGRQPNGRVDVDRYGNAMLSVRADDMLRLVSRTPTTDPAILRTCPAVKGPWVNYLQVPLATKPAVAPLAARLSAGRSTPYDTAAAIQEWLETNFVYDPAVRVPERARDAMAFFFNTRRGACDLIASAMAMLARASGIPARVAVGYDQGERQVDGTYVVKLKNAHAWAELYFENCGWVPFNPHVPAPDSHLQTEAEMARARQQLTRRNVILACWAVLAVWLSSYAWRQWQRSRPTFTATPHGTIAKAWHEATRLLARRRLARRLSETASEYLRRLSHLAPEAQWLTGLARLTRLYEHTRYDLGPVGEQECQEALQALADVRRELRRWRPPRRRDGA